MRSTLSSSSRGRARVLYAGVVIFVVLALSTIRSIYSAWHTRSGEARAEAVLNLVAQRTPSRPTEAPGAMAWLRLELDRYEQHIPDPRRAAIYRGLAASAERVPDQLASLSRHLRTSIADGASARVRLLPAVNAPSSRSSRSLRSTRLAEFDGQRFIVTRRRALDGGLTGDTGLSDRFVRSVVPTIAAGRAAIRREIDAHPLPAVPDARPPRPVRLYAVSEDGTLVSEPWDANPVDVAVAQEAALLSARPGLPTFAPQEFFFRFDPSATAATPPAYSGFYLDLGGRGLVSTLLAPIDAAAQHGVVALDLAFEIDWDTVAAGVEAPVAGAAVRIGESSAASWSAFETALATSAPAALHDAVRSLATLERQRATSPDEPSPLRHGIVSSGGAVAAFQVSDTTWLLMHFPDTAPAFPIAAVGLLAGMLVVLLVGFEVNRRRADTERQNAERALTEKQSLLNTMQVPLVVVDPNNDVIVSSNRAAETIGIRAGSRFADLVWPDARSREHYERMQVASPEPRRAYGLPVAVQDERGQVVQRYAVVRSVAVTAPIAALSADQRHRLGVLFVLDADDDLSLFASEVDARAHRDERQRLAGLLSHGIDTLARVLEHCLGGQVVGRATVASAEVVRPEEHEFVAWLSEYLERRLTVTAWLLDHWDATPPIGRDHIVDAEQVRATLARLSAVLGLVRDDRELRSRLHWDNGTLSASPGHAVLDVRIDWPGEIQFTSPVRGGVGMFLGEVVTNAVRHGRPGTTPLVDIRSDAVRREVIFRVENATRGDAASPPQGEAYGGLSILRALARLFDWRDLTFAARGGTFVAEWRVPASFRGQSGEAD